MRGRELLRPMSAGNSSRRRFSFQQDGPQAHATQANVIKLPRLFGKGEALQKPTIRQISARGGNDEKVEQINRKNATDPNKYILTRTSAKWDAT